MRKAGLYEAQAGIKIAGKNTNNPRYADDTTRMAESEEELKSFLVKVKQESEKPGLKISIQRTEITAFTWSQHWRDHDFSLSLFPLFPLLLAMK